MSSEITSESQGYRNSKLYLLDPKRIQIFVIIRCPNSPIYVYKITSLKSINDRIVNSRKIRIKLIRKKILTHLILKLNKRNRSKCNVNIGKTFDQL